MVGSSDGLKVCQAAFSIGNPFWLDQSLTSGIISGVERRLSIDGQKITKVIHTDAEINPGNSPALGSIAEIGSLCILLLSSTTKPIELEDKGIWKWRSRLA
jgi:hypothetical protein